MANKFQILTQAFQSIDAAPIDSFEGDSQEAIWAANNYEHIKELALSKRAWNFAEYYETLTQTVATPSDPRWKYEFLIPAECLSILQVLNSTGRKIPYLDRAGRIYTNERNVSLKYTRNVVETDMPVYFVEYLIKLLAYNAASFTLETDTITRKYQESEIALREASKRDMQNNPPKVLVTDENSTILASRFGG